LVEFINSIKINDEQQFRKRKTRRGEY